MKKNINKNNLNDRIFYKKTVKDEFFFFWINARTLDGGFSLALDLSFSFAEVFFFDSLICSAWAMFCW